MTTPDRGPRPVGPPPPPPRQPSPGSVPPVGPPWPPGSAPSGSARGSDRGSPSPGEGSWSRVYRWDPEGWRTWSTEVRGRPGPIIFGIILLLVGVGLLVELVVPALSFVSLVIFAAGIGLAYAWLSRGVIGATVPALVLIGWGAASLGGDLGILPGDGWTALLVGLGLILAGAAGRQQRARRDWAFWVGGLLAIIGLADASDVLPGSWDLAVVVPLAIIGLGAYLIWRGRSNFA